MKWQKLLVLAATGILFICAAVPPDASGVPAFARRYKISCTTCHAPFPKLIDYGEEFAGNGFIIPEEEKDRDYITAGDDLLHLNKDFPFAVRFDAYAVYNDGSDIKNDLQTPWGLKFLSGGALAKGVGYYFYFYMAERGEVAGIEDAIIHFDNLFGSELDVAVGQFQTSDPLMKRELRLTYEDYEIYRRKIGLSNTNLTYDRGVMISYGIAQTGTDLVALVVNGNGKDEAGEDKIFDGDKYKNVGFRVSQAVGEVGSIGGFVYYGKERGSFVVEDPIDIEGPIDVAFTNEVTYWGPDVNFSAGPLEFTGQYLLRKDDNPDPSLMVDDIESAGIVAELIFAPDGDKSRHYFTALYNQVDSDLGRFDYETFTVSGTYLIARNLRAIVEYTRDLEREWNRITIGTVTAF